MNRSLKAVVIVLSAGFIGAAFGRIHRELGPRENDLVQRVDRLQRLKALPAPGAPAGTLQDLSGIATGPRIALPTPPKPSAALEPGRTKEDPALANLPENLLLPLNPPKPGTPVGAPARSPGTPGSPGPSPKPVAALSDDQQIAGFLKAARKAVASGAFGEARTQAAKASGLPGSAERLAEAKRLEALSAIGEKLLPESDRWRDVYASGWISVQLRSFGKVVEGRDLGETALGFVVGRRNGRQTVPKTEAGKVERLASSQARARFEAEAWVRAEEAGEDASRVANLLSAAKFAWEMNLPETALEILGQAVDEDPSVANATGIPSVPKSPGVGSIAVVPLSPASGPETYEDDPPPAEAPDPAPGASNVQEPDPPEAVEPSKDKNRKPPDRKSVREAPRAPSGPRSGGLSKAASLVVAGTNARHAGNRDESLRVYGEAIAMLKPMLSGPERKAALLELSRAEHGVASVYLVRKEWATAYIHYKNSAYYLEIGGYPIKLATSGNLQRIDQMKAVLGGRVPDWKPPE